MEAHEISEDRKQLCTELIEKGMQHCRNCETADINNKEKACTLHLKMYGNLYP